MTIQTNHRAVDEVGVVSTLTLVVWLCCMAIGVAGLTLHYPQPTPAIKPPTPVQAQVMHVELTNDTSPPPDIGPPSTPADEPAPQPPPMPDVVAAPQAAPLTPVATPSPAIAFAVPVQGPTQTVAPKDAIPKRAPATAATQTASPVATAAATAKPAAQHLTFGEGEGKQPAPEYPREAAMAHQQGTVVVRFTVGEDGRVLSAEASTPSPYALLNQAAVRAVREDWRFRAGPPRTYEVSIEFRLKHR